MPIEEKITTCVVLPWEFEKKREDLLVIRIRRLQSRTKDIHKATTRLKEARMRNKDRFDKFKRIDLLAIWIRQLQSRTET